MARSGFSLTERFSFDIIKATKPKEFYMSPQSKIRAFSLICLYPIVSTLVMTLIWQVLQRYVDPFLGGYYFKWVFLYSENNPEWLSASFLPLTRILYFVYIGGYALLFVLTLLTLFLRNGKVACSWAICGLWLADCGWIIMDIVMSGVQWQDIMLLVEHLIFIACTILFSVFYLRLKKEFPEWFKKHKNKTAYRKRFQ